MTIHCICSDPERGKYLAWDAENPEIIGESYTSTLEAVGIVVQKLGISVIEIGAKKETIK